MQKAEDSTNRKVRSGAARPPAGIEPPAAAIDASRLQRLLSLAGPEVGAELLANLDRDLAQAGEALTQAVGAADAAAIRSATHVLIGLGGTVGATGLEDAARQLNTLATEGRLGKAQASITAVLAGIEALRTFANGLAAGDAAP